MFIITGKTRGKRIHIEWVTLGVDVMRDKTLKRRDLNVSHTLGSEDKTDSKTNPSGHDTEGDSRPGQTRKKPRGR